MTRELQPGDRIVLTDEETGREYQLTIGGRLGKWRLRRFEVTLEMRLGHACVGSTKDVIQAASAEEAEAAAIAAWRVKRPDLTFAPLLTIELREGR